MPPSSVLVLHSCHDVHNDGSGAVLHRAGQGALKVPPCTARGLRDLQGSLLACVRHTLEGLASVLLSCSKGRPIWGLVLKTNTINKTFTALLWGGLAMDQVWWLLVAVSVVWLLGFVLGGILPEIWWWCSAACGGGSVALLFAARTCCPSRVPALTLVGA